ASGPGRLAQAAAEAFARHAAGLELDRVDDPRHADVILACGPLDWELALFRQVGRQGLLLGGLSPGLASFPQLLGRDPDGYLAPVQWHPDLHIEPELGPSTIE